MKTWRRLVGTIAASALACAGMVTLTATAASASGDCRPAVFETDGYGHGADLANFAHLNANFPADWQAIPIRYQDGVFPIKDPHPLKFAVQIAVDQELAAVRDFHARCPGAHITILGYSEGAAVGGDVLQKLSETNEIGADQINGVLYGDPKRPFSYSGIGGTAGGIETNLPTILPGVTMAGPHHFGDIPVAEVCKENDGICNSANLFTNALAVANGIKGYFNGDHGYDFDPWRDSAPGNTFIHQPVQQVGFGAPLPVALPTPWQLQRNDPTGFSQQLTSILDQIGKALDWGSWVPQNKPTSPLLRGYYQQTT